MTKTEIDLINEHHSDAVIETLLAPLPWRSVVTDAVVYDPLTGTYQYTEQPKPDTYNEFWTPLGQPRTTGRMTEKVINKDKSPRKEKKKKPKEKK
jgi:hypothetical protein